ncbi:hypothetical protein L1D14_07330 [Vibrio tubiashii]|uniref:hypothetical protein n=1 Tax=Vibrio tubiashii TaxID=29498 RepID=UPI001EFCAF85|nr:hypothetical protein [Vibrio tubiashii]MCG9576049.1 hypothetical protein [Vibrio tubiashii]
MSDQKVIKLKTQLAFLAKGTVLKEDCERNFFVDMSAEMFNNGPFTTPTPRVCGKFIRANPDLYEELSWAPSKDDLICRALNRVEATLPGEDKLIAMLNEALLASDNKDAD